LLAVDPADVELEPGGKLSRQPTLEIHQRRHRTCLRCRLPERALKQGIEPLSERLERASKQRPPHLAALRLPARGLRQRTGPQQPPPRKLNLMNRRDATPNTVGDLLDVQAPPLLALDLERQDQPLALFGFNGEGGRAVVPQSGMALLSCDLEIMRI